MILGALKEQSNREKRIPLLPASIKKMIDQGMTVYIEEGLGESLFISDQSFRDNGAQIRSRSEILASADILVRISKPALDDIKGIKSGTIHLSYLDPFNDPEILKQMTSQGLSAISLEMIPRTTLAQKMDVLSSQASLAGYYAVVLAASRISKAFPMMMTPAGTIPPARVFVVGAGVAGLQAIATAKRLGARVEAFDTRPAVEEQVKSLGARFLKIDLGETGEAQGGYAKQLTEEQLKKQRQEMAKVCAQSDIVITTAQVFGKKAPRIITNDMIMGMRPGSVIVDMAVETGGNVEGSLLDQDVLINGVLILGLSNLPGKIAADASSMFSNNITSLILHYWDKGSKSLKLSLEDEILKGCLLASQGKILNEKFQHLQKA